MAVLTALGKATPWVLLLVIIVIAGTLIAALSIALHQADAKERPDIIRALRELFWGR